MLTVWMASVLRKLDTGTSGANLYFTQQKRTDNNDLVFKCCILHKIVVGYITNSASCRISELFAVRIECSFYYVHEI
jgi:hypothetical protein